MIPTRKHQKKKKREEASQWQKIKGTFPYIKITLSHYNRGYMFIIQSYFTLLIYTHDEIFVRLFENILSLYHYYYNVMIFGYFHDNVDDDLLNTAA